MEYLLVHFADEDRGVVVDDEPQGRTNEVIEIERGTHTVRLESPPLDFDPPEAVISLRKTTRLSPEEVTFVKV
jgi:hypothetical protein